MPEQKQTRIEKEVRPQRKEGNEAQEPEVTPKPTSIERGKELKEKLDKLMDEIDETLEENAEQFVRSYVQRGGE